jgi:hypothetical protein
MGFGIPKLNLLLLFCNCGNDILAALKLLIISVIFFGDDIANETLVAGADPSFVSVIMAFRPSLSKFGVIRTLTIGLCDVRLEIATAKKGPIVTVIIATTIGTIPVPKLTTMNNQLCYKYLFWNLF